MGRREVDDPRATIERVIERLIDALEAAQTKISRVIGWVPSEGENRAEIVRAALRGDA